MPSHLPGRLRVALLVYRGSPYSGGLGVYVRNLSRSLVRLGHEVTVFAGQPYPVLEAGVGFEPLPSLDLYGEKMFRVPRPWDFRDRIDLLEFGLMCTAAFPEPLTFSLRARRALLPRLREFDVVHDNAGLGSGLSGLLAAGMPVVGTIHHAIEIDRRTQLEAESRLRKRITYRRWYSFVRMQARVARELPRVLTVSEASRDDIVRESGVALERLRVVPNGVDAEVFRPIPDVRREPDRLITTASADVPVKGLAHLLEAVAKLRTERDARLVVVGKPKKDGPTPKLLRRFGLADAVEFVHGIDDEALARQYARASVAVVPSLYEGFSLPAVEAMACGVPVVATTGGALPEVVGDAALTVPPGDAGALAAAISDLFDDPCAARALGEAGRRRVLDRYTWERAARATERVYREAIEIVRGTR